MRKVIIHKVIGMKRAEVGTEGYLHHWGVEADGEGSNTIAVIECDDGTVIEAYPEMIRFLEPFATTAKLAATPAGIARACGLENEVERAAEVSATNPPRGWRLAAKGEARAFGYIWFDREEKAWQMGYNGNIGRAAEGCEPVANPIEVAP